jgi:hypothetical protein
MELPDRFWIARVERLLIPLLNAHTFLPRKLSDRPSLRALSDHRFIVGAQRARRMVWQFPSYFRGRAFREQENG